MVFKRFEQNWCFWTTFVWSVATVRRPEPGSSKYVCNRCFIAHGMLPSGLRKVQPKIGPTQLHNVCSEFGFPDALQFASTSFTQTKMDVRALTLLTNQQCCEIERLNKRLQSRDSITYGYLWVNTYISGYFIHYSHDFVEWIIPLLCPLRQK